jgi:hypothetical protein
MVWFFMAFISLKNVWFTDAIQKSVQILNGGLKTSPDFKP